MNSRNHHMFSSISAWLLTSVGSLDATGGEAACDGAEIELRPAASLGVSFASTQRVTRCGQVRLEYRRHGGLQCARVPASPAPTAPSHVTLSCGAHGGRIERVAFASWGAPSGVCGGSWTAAPGCDAGTEIARHVEAACVGRVQCSLPTAREAYASVGNETQCDRLLGSQHASRVLAVQVECGQPSVFEISAQLPLGGRARISVPMESAKSRAAQVRGADGALWASEAPFPPGVRSIARVSSGVNIQVGSGLFSFLVSA